ncbi:helix-turn-helix domain-containing protein [Leptospira terpstrae]|uniref:DNA-binding helix-turn-helix protein n=1 Tax=Leptospira terpstrae serovar Hualin str. LT 11-33 = ATCC 700639 TaxID=1257025 RepID=N1VPE4_9LEPT|nr:helix-turn-helix domain-containing protein [Leptospira terpstrae]EMY61614.1 DNA-binding helix-turn-helix protein [Leptospira terpstrae serovar Hualin str. LT 11-33 = ATCC 700639]
MKIQSYFPSFALRPYIQKYLIIETENGIENRILPNPHLVLSFQLQGNLRSLESNTLYDLPRMGIAGFRKTVRKIIYPQNSSALLVIFTEIGATAFFKEPISDFYEKTISLENLISNSMYREMEEKLFESQSSRDCINLIENFLLHIQRQKQIDPILRQTLVKIQNANGNIKMKALKQGLPISLDSLEKKCKEMVGTTLKHYANIIRIRSAITSYSPTTSLTDLAYNAGYFDQSHFNKDFKLYTGESPKVFFQNPQNW